MGIFDRLRSVFGGGNQPRNESTGSTEAAGATDAHSATEPPNPTVSVEKPRGATKHFSPGINENVKEFYGRPVRDFDPGADSIDPAQFIYRLALDWDAVEKGAKFDDIFQAYMNQPNASDSVGLVIGDWGHAAEESAKGVITSIVSAGDKLAGLKALFLGDITPEECEISWICQTDISPLWLGLPDLEELRVRGSTGYQSEGLSLGDISHQQLKTIVIQTGGLPARVLRSLAAADLPQLEHLQLWLGEEEYGWDGSVDDIEALLGSGKLPAMKYLGLCNSQIANEIAKVVAQAPMLEQLDVLDLSMGALGDEGALALAESELVKTLNLLDITHHYVTAEGLAAMNKLGIQVNAAYPQQEDVFDDGEVYRYIAVSE